jgi:sugar phosphate isomerase/epimerase
MTLDIGHAYVAKRAKGVEDPEGAIIEDLEVLGGEQVTHVHLNNNKGKRDDHLITEGQIDLRRILSFLKEGGYSGKIIVESYEMEREGIPFVLEKLETLWVRGSAMGENHGLRGYLQGRKTVFQPASTDKTGRFIRPFA